MTIRPLMRTFLYGMPIIFLRFKRINTPMFQINSSQPNKNKVNQSKNKINIFIILITPTITMSSIRTLILKVKTMTHQQKILISREISTKETKPKMLEKDLWKHSPILSSVKIRKIKLLYKGLFQTNNIDQTIWTLWMSTFENLHQFLGKILNSFWTVKNISVITQEYWDVSF